MKLTWSLGAVRWKAFVAKMRLLRAVKEDMEAVRSLFETHVQEKTGFRQEFRTIGYDSKPRWVALDALPQHDAESGDFVGFIGAVMDISDRKRLEDERLIAIKNAETIQRKRAEDAEELKCQQEGW
jgi:PAS domain-containing protein